MSTPTLISISGYLSTTYRPDCDYVDGEIRERNVGESEHSILQAAITAWFWNHQREWGIEVRPELRVQVSPTPVSSTRRLRVEGRSTARADREHPTANLHRDSLESRYFEKHARTGERLPRFWDGARLDSRSGDSRGIRLQPDGLECTPQRGSCWFQVHRYSCRLERSSAPWISVSWHISLKTQILRLAALAKDDRL